MRYHLALLVGKLAFWGLRLLGRQGTALPGLVAERVAPEFLAIARKHFDQVVVITGTNGKTSTQTVLSRLLAEMSGQTVLVNSRGANLSRGLAAEVIKQLNFFGTNHFRFGVFEVEEATLPKIIKLLEPDMAIVTNFFRDQLDAYGEINRTKMHVRNALDQINSMQIVANGDDPQVLDCINGIRNQKISLISINDYNKFIQYEASDNQINPKELGKVIRFASPEITPNLGSKMLVDNQTTEILLPGFHSAYAVALAITAARNLFSPGEFNIKVAAKIMRGVKPAFGRGEVINTSGKSLQIFLVKNPVGFDVTLDLLAHSQEDFSLALLVNDNIADGRDVSWLWDSQLEKLTNLKLSKLYFGGVRGLDMQLRVKYAGDFSCEQEYFPSLKQLLKAIKQGNETNVKIIATYTAMNQFRDLLRPRG